MERGYEKQLPHMYTRFTKKRGLKTAFRCTNRDFYVALGSSAGFGTFGLGRWWSVKSGFYTFFLVMSLV